MISLLTISTSSIEWCPVCPIIYEYFFVIRVVRIVYICHGAGSVAWQH
jgi:hypothetical protein